MADEQHLDEQLPRMEIRTSHHKDDRGYHFVALRCFSVRGSRIVPAGVTMEELRADLPEFPKEGDAHPDMPDLLRVPKDGVKIVAAIPLPYPCGQQIAESLIEVFGVHVRYVSEEREAA